MITRLTKPPVDLRADRLEAAALYLAGGTAAQATLVLLGGSVGSPLLKSVAPAAFLLTGVGLLGLHARAPRMQGVTQLLAVIVLLIATVTLCGYTYHVSGLVQVGEFIPMALNTAFGFAALSVGIL